jgi:hypothetical protein
METGGLALTVVVSQLMSHTAGFCYDGWNPKLLKWSAQQDRKENMFSGTIVRVPHP